MHRVSLWGMNIGLGSDVESSGEIYALRKFAKGISSGESPVVFDVGANIGDFATSVHRIFRGNCIIHCFEPSSSACRILERKFKDWKNINIHKMALGNHTGEATLFLDKEASGCASLYKRKDFDIRITETVSVCTLDEFCDRNNIPHINYLKLDVEGHELYVLQGGERILYNGGVDWIQFEFGGCNIDSRTFFRDFYEILSRDYVIYRLLRNGFSEIRQYHETQEIFTTTNFLAVRENLLRKV